jgi:RNA polymerase sigma factor (sigma-70 family)
MATAEQFEALIEQHKKILCKVCNSYCHNRDDREDLAQEIVVQIWRSLPLFDERSRFSTWMYRIALNVAISFWRQEEVRTRHVLSIDEQILNAIDEPDGQQDDVRLLYSFIGTLDPLHKGLLLLYLDGHSYLEIGEVLGITETNVATKITRLKVKMRQELGVRK